MKLSLIFHLKEVTKQVVRLIIKDSMSYRGSVHSWNQMFTIATSYRT